MASNTSSEGNKSWQQSQLAFLSYVFKFTMPGTHSFETGPLMPEFKATR
jgi:hypothetical protein